MNVSRLIGFVSLFLLSHAVFGEIKLPAIISDNMVLQQRSEVALWGHASPNHSIIIITSWNSNKYTAISDSSGSWTMSVKTPSAGGPYKIIFDEGNDKLTLKNILIGEVWVCSGQSNMERPMRGAIDQPVLNSNKILMRANDSKLRLFHVPRKISEVPLTDCQGTWQLSSPESAATFSAVGYQFAKKMQEVMKVPVGIIEVAWGGTPIRAWMDGQSLQPFRAKLPPITTKRKQDPSVLFNGMMNPIVGYGIKGFIWYQGEWNRHNPHLYKDLMVSMVERWRNLWKRGDLPFYYVQIAPFDYKDRLKDSVPYVREAQTNVMKEISNSGMVVSMDVGNKYVIHPPDKTTIARRLLYWALGDTYGWRGISYRNPSFKSMNIEGNHITISFDNTPMGLTSFDKKIEGFEIAGEDSIFYPADAAIKGKGKVVLYSKQVKEPVAVRYLFKDWAVGNLYSTSGLPVAPFRTDQW